MKKIIIYILLTFLISISMIGTTTFAKSPTENNKIIKSILLVDDSEYKPTFIPKPGLLPGPSEEAQKKEFKPEEGKKGARNILVDTILPYFGVAVIGFVGTASLIFLIIAGVRFATAYGNDEAIQKAKDQAMYALIGLVIALLSYAIVRIITNIRYEGTTEQTTYNQIEIINIG